MKSPVKEGKPGFRADESAGLRLAAAPEIDSRRFPARAAGPGRSLLPNGRNSPYDPTTPGSMPAVSERPVVRRPGPMGGVAAAAEDAAPADAPSPGAEPLPADAGKSGVSGWGLAPLRWGGSTGQSAYLSSSGSGARSFGRSDFVGLRGSSYLYQPWLAQVSGNIMLSTSSGKSSSGPQDESSSKSMGLSGGGSLNLFPVSRFPASVTYDVTDSRSRSELASNGSTGSRFGFRQSYSPEGGGYNAAGSYNRSDVSAGAQGKDAVNALQGSFSSTMGFHSLQTGASYSASAREATGEGSRLLSLNAQHAYQAMENLNLNSFASVTDNALNYSRGALGMAQSHGRTMQFNSSANWHPAVDEEDEDEDAEAIPLNVSGGVNAFSAQNAVADNNISNLSLGANLAASYRYNQNLTLSANGLATSVTSNGRDPRLLTGLGGGANYSGDPLVFEKFSYGWNVGVNGNQQTGGVQGSIQTVSGQFGHSLSRPVEIDAMSGLHLTFGQSVADTASSQGGNSASVSHNAGANYRVARGDNLNGSAALSLSDTMTIGATAGHFSSLSLNLSGQAQINSRSMASVNLAFQYSTVASSTAADSSTTQSAVSRESKNANVFGSAAYQHQRAFGIPGLRYALSFNANTMASPARDERLAGNVSSVLDSAAFHLDNRVDYRVGLVDLQLKGVIASTAGNKNASVFFNMTRQFGKY